MKTFYVKCVRSVCMILQRESFCLLHTVQLITAHWERWITHIFHNYFFFIFFSFIYSNSMKLKEYILVSRILFFGFHCCCCCVAFKIFKFSNSKTIKHIAVIDNPHALMRESTRILLINSFIQSICSLFNIRIIKYLRRMAFIWFLFLHSILLTMMTVDRLFLYI